MRGQERGDATHLYWAKFFRRPSFLAAAFLLCALAPIAASAQTNESGGLDAGSCTLRDHIYTCNGAEFRPLLTSATTVGISVHNADGVARDELTDLLVKKLGKSVAVKGTPADLIFLLIPIEPSGIVDAANDAPLGTLRVYSSTPDGTPAHLLWAESYSGAQDIPWPLVVHSLIKQFQSHFHIK